jgi:hypothetical protein
MRNNNRTDVYTSLLGNSQRTNELAGYESHDVLSVGLHWRFIGDNKRHSFVVNQS